MSLSSRLVNVEGFVLRMRKPLVELKVLWEEADGNSISQYLTTTQPLN